MQRKMVVRTIVVIGAPKWVDAQLEKSALREGILREWGGGQQIELRRDTFHLEDTVSPKEALEEIAEAQSPTINGPMMPPPMATPFKDAIASEPLTTDVPPEGQES